MSIRILLVEDDKEIVENLSVLLREEGFGVAAAETKASAMELLGHDSFDLALLDVGLPDGSGYALCTAVRRQYGIPVIFLTAMGDEASVVTGFELGGDDYISKPFRPLELISRVKNVLRRKGRQKAVYQVGDLYIDTVKGAVSKGGQELFLSALEYRLLLVFVNHGGETLSRYRLLDEIWDAAGEYVNDNTLTVYIKRLREKIETDPADPKLIRTVRGIGYRMEGPDGTFEKS
ncbi:MAG: response regulator transcription factor [Clostridiales bacterium]|nr:response regulator transcription factor [Clostridiales bacterium]